MPRRSSHRRHEDYDDDSNKYSDPFMGYTSEFDNPNKNSEQSSSRYSDPYSSYSYDNSSSRDQAAYPPTSYETPYSSIRDEPAVPSRRSSHRKRSSSRYETPSGYEDSFSSIAEEPLTTSNYEERTSSSSSRRDKEDRSSRRHGSSYMSTMYEEPASSSYDSNPYSSRRDSHNSASGYDLQDSFTRSVLGRSAPPRPRDTSFETTFDYYNPDNPDLYPSTPGRYSSGPTSDPFSNEKHASSKGSRRHRRSRR